MTSASDAPSVLGQTVLKAWPLGRSAKLAVLVSGRGSNLQALHASAVAHQFSVDWLVISNRKESSGLAWARNQGLNTRCMQHQDFDSREAFDVCLASLIKDFQPDLVVLAGFMRILSSVFFSGFDGPMINIHPSLLPAYPGLNTHRRALHDGVTVHGATVHSVTPQLDHGPILAQALVGVYPEDDEERLADRVLKMEHQLLPMVTWALLRGDLELSNGRWFLRQAQTHLPHQLQFSRCLVHPQLSASSH